MDIMNTPREYILKPVCDCKYTENQLYKKCLHHSYSVLQINRHFKVPSIKKFPDCYPGRRFQVILFEKTKGQPTFIF